MPLNKYSRRLTKEPSQGASQAMLIGTGLSPADLEKPQVGIASVWYEGNTCNMHLLGLSEEVKRSVGAASLVGMRFNTVGVSDGISMGTDGMSYSLQSRDLIADSIETVVAAHWYDGLVTIPGCDKNMPGCVMAMLRLNRPGFMIYGGTIRAGCWKGQKLDVVSAFQAYGEHLSGAINEEERIAKIRSACPGAGACGGMYTANSMAVAIETMGLSLPYSSSAPAEDDAKKAECSRAGAVMRMLLERDLKPKDIVTRRSLENAAVAVTAMGGSTNAVLHLLAIADAADVPFSLDDFQSISDRTPLLADFRPSGRFVMEDLHRVGGTPAVLKYLLGEGLIDGSCLTVTGKTLRENLAGAASLAEDQEIVSRLEKPLKRTGHLQILRGNLAPEGSVAKITGKEGERFAGPARVFDSEEAMIEGLKAGEIRKGDVIVIRYEGPKGGPGMPEMLTPTSAVIGAGLGKDVALITDGRFSGGSHGFIVGHICPEAQEGGPIALVRDGDGIVIDALSNTITVQLDAAELESRGAAWSPPPLKCGKGALSRYVKTVRPATAGCTTD